MVDRLERLTDLVLLLGQGRPRSLREIGDSIPGYPAEGEARRQAFERDKRSLRAGGVEITTVPIGGKEQTGYLIRSEDFYLPDLELAADEQAALNLAVAGVHLDDATGRDALWRLGLPASAGGQPVAQLPAIPALSQLHGAIRTRSEITFDYRGERRYVDPALLRFRGGSWYLIGFDRDRDAARTFRVDRIEGAPVVGAPGTSRLPEGFDASRELPELPWKMGEAEPVNVEVLVDPLIAQLVTAEVGESTVSEIHEDGSLVLKLEVMNVPMFRSWVLELGDHAEVLGPPEVTEEIVSWLESIVSYGRDRSSGDRSPKRASSKRAAARRSSLGTSPPSDRQEEVETEAVHARAEAGKRLHRLLAVLTWLAREGRAAVSDLAERFGMSADELVSDLELAACCGLPPYTPDQLMEILVDDKEVVSNLGPELARPRRLTTAEGFALATSARAILAVPGSDPGGALGRALSKLELALGDRGSVRVDLGEPPHLEAVRQAVLEGKQLELHYYSASSDDESTRVVDPVDVVALDGRWYLDAYCHRANGMRRFRVDRISELAPTGRPLETHDGTAASAASGAAFVPGPDATLARIRVDQEASWVLDTVPVIESHTYSSGHSEVLLGVSSTVWFERFLLRLGPHVQVLEPPELMDTAPAAARELLERYQNPRSKRAAARRR